ncbi:Invasion associated locus B (IalB) protein [Roseovarius albus]|uniref:Invasion associated locus B (IalB) protein n=1 Tax=Roseovarius albus TaxID=1247867 RepID=A0A1X6YZW7_9RHOB|nr:invasion associated locus B family protein [Roseovarius albus]SLN36043.1 Invasion associated locus B (IalB) protein [Roseovarius albus]
MTKLYSSLSIIAVLAMGSMSYAQEETTETADTVVETENTTTETDAPAAEETPENTAEESQEAAAPALGEPAQPTVYIGETYGDWQVKCYTSEAEKDPCNMYQLLPDQAGNPVATIDLFRLAEGTQAVAGATIAVPLGTLLTQDLKIGIDGANAKVYKFLYCDANACFSQLGFTQGDVDAFKAGNEAVLQIIPYQAPDRPVNIRISLDGFTAAYNSDAVKNN